MKQGIRIDRLTSQHKILVEIKVSRQFKIRMWFGSQLLRLAGLVFGCQIELKNADTREFA